MRLKLLLLLTLLVFVPTANADKPCRINCEIKMGRLVTSGFELQDLQNINDSPDRAAVSSITGASYDTANPRSGAVSLKLDSLVANGARNWAAPAANPVTALGNTLYTRVYFKFANLPTSTVRLIAYGTGRVSARLTSTGTLQLWDDAANTQIGSDSITNIIADSSTWYRIELSALIATGNDTIELRLDGQTVAQQSGVNIVDTAIATVTAGWNDAPGASSVLWMDDIAINDSVGANQNTWPGPGKVVLLKPLNDNAKGTGWTNDQASTTNLFDSVDNTPPLGIADTTAGGGTHQLRNATSNANSNYDADMQSYTAAGIGSSDTITVLDPIIATGAPVTTSAKQGTVGVVSNPTIANIALGTGGTAGAFWSGVTAGSYPTGWKWSHGTITYAPTIVKATRPTMRVTQVTASTRIAMVCAMGIYVEYIPASSLVVSKPGSAHSRFRRAAQSFDRW